MFFMDQVPVGTGQRTEAIIERFTVIIERHTVIIEQRTV